MSSLTETLMDLAKHIAARPTFFALTPQEANGMMLAIASVILHNSSGKQIVECMHEVTELMRESMEGVYPSPEIIPSLADESFPQRNPSFDAFRRNCESFIAVFEKHISMQGG